MAMYADEYSDPYEAQKQKALTRPTAPAPAAPTNFPPPPTGGYTGRGAAPAPGAIRTAPIHCEECRPGRRDGVERGVRRVWRPHRNARLRQAAGDERGLRPLLQRPAFVVGGGQGLQLPTEPGLPGVRRLRPRGEARRLQQG